MIVQSVLKVCPLISYIISQNITFVKRQLCLGVSTRELYQGNLVFGQSVEDQGVNFLTLVEILSVVFLAVNITKTENYLDL